ncbi:hypothetical protein CTAYLR_002534 [Chrysophaeum taylorii]|uniref:tyrosine--tRNA ligase n=1 Tax=Chrysophaeum taylorii TaxID=2483200 RepID=A0AAD7UF58_9STRA|nr:hypothetical protein CTAYLR_002534 [Chrysophaeum taylorii]
MWPAGWSANDGTVYALEAKGIREFLETDRAGVLLSVGEECVNASEVGALLARPSFRLYDGFEPSGRMHIAQGVFKAQNVNKCTQVGGIFVFWVADWFALMNDKMGGDLEKIKTVGEYLVEVWRAAGMRMDRVEFRWASEEITKHASAYWPLVLDVARRFTIARIKKCCQIMGRGEGGLTAAQILYPLMQCSDIFFLKADVCQLGVDQRKVNMLAREYCDAASIKQKPVILSHHMLYGLKAGQAKMSKSDPDSAIFMEDSEAEVCRKISNAYCPLVVDESVRAAHEASDMRAAAAAEGWQGLMNPCLDYVKHVVFAPPGAVFEANGRSFYSPDAVGEAFVDGTLSEVDLKAGLAAAINRLLEPVRRHFKSNAAAASLLDRVRSFKKNNNSSSTGNSSVRETAEARQRALDRALAKTAAWLGGSFSSSSSETTAATKIGAVFVLPALSPSLGDLVTLSLQLARASDDGKEPVLILCDWSAIAAADSLDGDSKAILASLRLIACAVDSLFALLLGGGRRCRILLQSHLILERPSEYWIDVIHAGRALTLVETEEATGVDDSVKVGPVVAALLRCADATAARASVLVDADRVSPSRLAEKRTNTPVITIDRFSTRLHMPAADGVPDLDENRDFFLLDGVDSVKRKIKRAFCEPGNVEFNPPLAIASFLLDRNLVPAIDIKRPPANGGDKAYASRQDLVADFRSQALHPGDLKPAVTDALSRTLIAAMATAVSNAKPALAAIKAFKKNQTKKGKFSS